MIYLAFEKIDFLIQSDDSIKMAFRIAITLQTFYSLDFFGQTMLPITSSLYEKCCNLPFIILTLHKQLYNQP